MRAVIIGIVLMCAGVGARPAKAQPAPKSPARAFWYAFANTTVPLGTVVVLRPEAGVTLPLLIYGFIAGPAAGHLYVRDHDRALHGIALRAGLAGAMAGGAAVMFRDGFIDRETDAAGALGAGLFIAGGLALVASTIADLDAAPEAARAYNAGHGLTVVPVAGRGAAGLAVRAVW